MLSDELKLDILEFIQDKVTTAEMVIDEVATPIQILRTEIKGDLLKIYTNASEGKGQITDLYIKDGEGNVIISKPRSILKNSHYGLVSSFYIRIREEIIENPINIFEMGGIVG
jgi:hypothetical protein